MKFNIQKSFVMLMIIFDIVMIIDGHNHRMERALSDLTNRSTNWMAKRKFEKC